MLTFRPFLTVNKTTHRVSSPKLSLSTYSFISLIQMTEQSLSLLVAGTQLSVSVNRVPDQHGIYVTSEPVNGHYMLFVQSKELEHKYQTWMEKVVLGISQVVIFGDRNDYGKLSECTRKGQVQMYMHIQSSNELFKVNSIEESRLEIGSSEKLGNIISTPPTRLASQASQIVWELNNYFAQPLLAQTEHLTSLAPVLESLTTAIAFRQEYKQFKESMIDKVSTMFKREELSRLLDHVSSLSQPLDHYTRTLVTEHQQQIRLINESRKQKLLQDIYERYRNINAQSYQQYRMEISVKLQLIRYSVSQYLPDSTTEANALIYKISNEFCQPFYQKMKEQLETEKETKQCLTNEVDRQIVISDNYKTQIQRLNAHIHDLSNIDQVLQEKQNALRELQARNDKLITSEIILQGQNLKKDSIIKNLHERNQDREAHQIRFLQQISNKNKEISNLSNSYRQMESRVEELGHQLKKKTDEANHLRKIFHTAHQAKSTLQKKVDGQERCLRAFNQNLAQLKREEKIKANFVISLNMIQHREVLNDVAQLQGKVVELENKLVGTSQDNKRLRIQILYFQKMYNQCKEKYPQSQPLIIIEEHNQMSTERLRVQPKQQRPPLSEANRGRVEGQEWCQSSRKEHQRSIQSTKRLGELMESRGRYF